MKSFLRQTSTKSSRMATLLWVVMCCGSLAAAFIVGISNNRLGLALCYVAASSIILAFVHRWRKVWKFLILLGASVIGFPLFVILHNLFYGLGELAAGIIVLSHLLEFLHATFFLIAVLVCPAGFLISAVGIIVTVITYFKKRLCDKQDQKGA